MSFYSKKSAILTSFFFLKFNVAFIGPTRELLEADLSLPAQVSEWQLSLSSSTWQPLPGYDFAVRAAVEERSDASKVSSIMC